MKGLTGIGHVAIRVKDVARTLEFYSGRLGFAEILRLHRGTRIELMQMAPDSLQLEAIRRLSGSRR